jgi:segregation and condensation protein B
MEFSKEQSIIEAMLFAAGREVSVKEIMNVLEIGAEDIDKIILNMKAEYEARNSGIELIKVDDSYQLCTRKDYYEYIYPLFDNRAKPNISNAALETLSIIAYNPNVTRAEIEAIRGVNADGTVYKLLEFDLIEESGKLDAPGRPTMYKVTSKFMKMFGITSLDELPELPRYKLDENEQIVIEDLLEEKVEIVDSVEESEN